MNGPPELPVAHDAQPISERLNTECYCVTLDRDALDHALEREANVFAAELLMPEPAVRSGHGKDPEETAERFGVSGEAMRWRLYSFGIGDRPQPPTGSSLPLTGRD